MGKSGWTGKSWKSPQNFVNMVKNGNPALRERNRAAQM